MVGLSADHTPSVGPEADTEADPDANYRRVRLEEGPVKIAVAIEEDADLRDVDRHLERATSEARSAYARLEANGRDEP